MFRFQSLRLRPRSAAAARVGDGARDARRGGGGGALRGGEFFAERVSAPLRRLGARHRRGVRVRDTLESGPERVVRGKGLVFGPARVARRARRSLRRLGFALGAAHRRLRQTLRVARLGLGVGHRLCGGAFHLGGALLRDRLRSLRRARRRLRARQRALERADLGLRRRAELARPRLEARHGVLRRAQTPVRLAGAPAASLRLRLAERQRLLERRFAVRAVPRGLAQPLRRARGGGAQIARLGARARQRLGVPRALALGGFVTRRVVRLPLGRKALGSRGELRA